MRLKLMVDGADQRIRITPDKGKADQKLLEYIMEWDIARIKINRNLYSSLRDVETIDLVLENERIEENGAVGAKDTLYPQT